MHDAMTQDEKAAEFQEVGLFEGVPFAAYSAWPGLRHSNIRLLV